MNRKKLTKIIQNYIGMTPKDKGCKNWSEMQEKMTDEILTLIYSTTECKNFEEFFEALVPSAMPASGNAPDSGSPEGDKENIDLDKKINDKNKELKKAKLKQIDKQLNDIKKFQ